MAKHRLVTRSDFDGLVCAILLKEIEMIDEIVFVHPKDMQDGKIPITARSNFSDFFSALKTTSVSNGPRMTSIASKIKKIS